MSVRTGNRKQNINYSIVSSQLYCLTNKRDFTLRYVECFNDLTFLYVKDNYQQICEQQIVWTGCKRPVERPFLLALGGTDLLGLYHIVYKPVLVMNVAKELIMRS
jgi:hypothetical protein